MGKQTATVPSISCLDGAVRMVEIPHGDGSAAHVKLRRVRLTPPPQRADITVGGNSITGGVGFRHTDDLEVDIPIEALMYHAVQLHCVGRTGCVC